MPGSNRAFHSLFTSPAIDDFVRLNSAIAPSSVALSLRNTPIALSSLPLSISHFGLSGMKKAIIRKSTVTKLSLPSIPRHISEEKIFSSRGEEKLAVSLPERMMKFTR